MNLKQLGILLILVIVLGGAGLALYKNQNAAWRSGGGEAGGKLLGNLPVNDITRISIRQGDDAVDLVRTNDEWRVRQRDDYPANFGQISEFLRKALEWKIVQSETAGPAQLARLQLAPPGQGTNSAMVVEFDGSNGKPLQTLWVGKAHMKEAPPGEQGYGQEGWPDGRYVRTGHSDTVAIISDPLDQVQPKPSDWLDKDFLRVDKAKSVEVDFPENTNSWKLTRETESGPWKLADAKSGDELDSSAAGEISSPLSSVSVTDVLPGGKLMGSPTNPITLVKIETFDGFGYTVQVGRKVGQDYPLTETVTARISDRRVPGKGEKPADKAKLDQEFKTQRDKLEAKLKQEEGYENWTYLVPSWSIDPLLKHRAQLLAAKKEPSKKEIAGNGDGEKSSMAGASAEKAQSEAEPVGSGK